MVEKDLTYKSRSRANVYLDENDKIEISKKSNYSVPKTNTVSFGKESFRWLGPKIWNSLPEVTKNTKSLETFRKRSKA